jgi:serine/threonine protein kinase/formylglycine-generating enzyme required for sulfatase activity
MSAAPRQAPEIRDHETLRLIGRGAYGEVWMARSVTGALRAVKVVWREDYDHADSFEREFEAIKRYEPISRRHPGLVPILQVGRSDAQGFYYYVMELADDLETGRDISPETYKPHTLGLEMRRQKQLKAQRCLEIGANVAEGLHHLHGHKLIHRDVKPSNLIFIDGQCRLADIGLVALLGQRSFVGTEGFVAPEGPGSAASDVFSLGMVLYEASTGKDRLDFPDIPSCSDSGDDLGAWQRLHRVICTACAPKAKDRYASAHEMALDLRGQPLPSTRRAIWQWAAAALIILGSAVGFGMWLAKREGGPLAVQVQKNTPALLIKTTPPGAHVYAGEDDLGTTPLSLNPEEGLPVIYQLRLPGYKHLEIEHTANRARPAEYDLTLEATRLPQPGERWTNSLGMAFKPAPGGHLSVQPVEIRHFKRFLEATGRSFEGRVVRAGQGKDTAYYVVAPVGDSEAFRFWLTDRDREAGLLSQEHHYEVEPFYYVDSPDPGAEDMPEDRENEPTTSSTNTEGADWQAFHLRVERQTYGSVVIRSTPEKVRVFQHEQFLGYTPLELPRVRSGLVEYELREEGFSDVVLDGEVRAGELLELFADMQTRQAVTFGREWKANGLGIRFVPLTDAIMIAATETRRRDYIEYTRATNARRPGNMDAEGKGGTHPIVGIDRQEARAFCAWLTERERNAGLIGPQDIYRLPSDDEWSRAVGLPLERGTRPSERNGRIRGIYPWGFDWPPPPNIDNLADAAGARKASLESFIPGYQDKFPQLAPVIAFPPNERGIHSLAGNASEWVDTDYDTAKPGDSKPPLATVRGGNWRSSSPEELLSSARTAVPPDTKRPTIGFRIVLERRK